MIQYQYQVTRYNNINVKLSNSQLEKLKSVTKSGTGKMLHLSSNMIAYSTDEANFPHKILLIIRQVTNFRKAFGEKSSANIKLSKPQMSKIIQSGGLLAWLLLGTIMKVVLPFMKKLIQPLTKKVLIPLGLTAA